MKSTPILLLMILGIVSPYGTSYASVFPQSESPSSETREEAVADRPSHGSKDLRGEQDQTGRHPGEDQHSPARVTKGAPKLGPSAGRPKSAASDPIHSGKAPASPKVRTDTYGTAAESRPTVSRSAGAPDRVIKRSAPPVLRPKAAALDGQQFKNVRRPGAGLAISGGPASSTRGTAAINGAEMKRRP